MDIDIICMACKTVGLAPLEKVASLRCRCGSDDFGLTVEAAPIMVEEGSSSLKQFLEDGWQRGRTQKWDRATYVYLIPPGETSDQADAMFKTRYRDKPPVSATEPVPDYLDPSGGRTRITPLPYAAKIAAWGIFKRLDNTPVYGPVPHDAVEIAMASGRYGDAEFYAGTMPDIAVPLELGGDPFREVTDTQYEQSYDGFRALTTRKVLAIREALMEANPGLDEEYASMLAEATVERYPVVVT